MLKVTVSVSKAKNMSDLADRIVFGAQTGLDIGGQAMAEVVGRTVGDLARYPTGELAQSVHYEPVKDGAVSEGRVVAGTDHAEPFEYGTFMHFVPYEAADERIRQGLYPHIKPVYDEKATANGGYGGNAGGGNEYKKDRIPKGYLVYSDEHPFMSVGFGASVNTVVQEVINQIETATDA